MTSVRSVPRFSVLIAVLGNILRALTFVNFQLHAQNSLLIYIYIYIYIYIVEVEMASFNDDSSSNVARCNHVKMSVC